MKKILLPGLVGLYASNFLLEFGFSLVGIFVPLYLLKITSSFNWIFVFYFVFNLSIVVSTLPSARLIARFGSDKISFLGTCLRAGCFLFLILGSSQPVFILLAAVFWGLAIPLFWLPFHLTVVGTDHQLSFGKDASRVAIFSRLGGVAGPILGGLVIQAFGFDWLYFLTIIFLIVSGLPIFFDRYEFKIPEISLAEIRRNLPIKKMFRLHLAFLGSGFSNQIYDIAWPLYVFLLIGSFQFLGAITSAGLLASFVLLLTAGSLADKHGNKILKFSLPLNLLNLMSRGLLITKLPLFLADLAFQLVSIFIGIPLDRLIYYTAIQTKKLEFFLSRELALHTGGALGSLLLLLLFNLGGLNWPLTFVFAAGGLVLVGQLVWSRKEEYLKSAGVVLIREDGAVLMQRRDNKADIIFPDYWCLPGGKVEIGEKPEAAADRELKEEIGYTVDSLSLLTEETYSLPDGQNIQRYIFWTKYDGIQEIKCFEGQEMEFLKLDEMKTRDIYPGHEEFCRQVLEKFKSS